MQVMKFGGSSLANARCILHVASVIREAVVAGETAVVCSAMQGVTDELMAVVACLRADELEQAQTKATSVIAIHRRALSELPLSTTERRRSRTVLEELEKQLMLELKRSGRDKPSAALAGRIAAFGERFSVLLVASTLRELGQYTQAVDASEFLITTAEFGRSRPLLRLTRARGRQLLLPLLHREITPIITGFLGVTRKGEPTTLGRNSSDYSAAVVASILDAPCLILWSDVDGFHTADPREDGETPLIPVLSYEEALKRTRKGAQIVHPLAIELLRERAIPLLLKNTFKPHYPGTRIGVQGGESVSLDGEYPLQTLPSAELGEQR